MRDFVPPPPMPRPIEIAEMIKDPTLTLLTLLQRRFVLAYLRHLNGSKAARIASCGVKCAHQQAYENMRKTKIGRIIDKGIELNYYVWAVDMTSAPYVRLEYSLIERAGNSIPHDLEVGLITTPCNFGGVRCWFACPMCDECVGGLYLAPGERHFMCRHCNNLTYDSRNESSPFGISGVTERKIKKLRSEIKRWTWRGRPKSKVRRLRALERKMGILGGKARSQLERFTAGFN